MTAFGIGATIVAFTANSVDKSKNKSTLLIVGALMLAGAVSLGNVVPFTVLLVLWAIGYPIAGFIGTCFINQSCPDSTN